MKTNNLILSLWFLLLPILIFSQTATIKGIILDEANQPIVGVNISAGDNGTQTNENGFYLLKISGMFTTDIVV